jgi:hypothetical protein
MNRLCLKALLSSSIALFIAFIAFAQIAEAMCVPPKLSLSSAKGERGKTLTVSGEHFRDRCNDVVINGQPPPSTGGARNIKILLKQGDQSRLLATVDANVVLRFSVIVTIPVDAPLGQAIIVAEAGKGGETPQPVAFEIIDNAK